MKYYTVHISRKAMLAYYAWIETNSLQSVPWLIRKRFADLHLAAIINSIASNRSWDGIATPLTAEPERWITRRDQHGRFVLLVTRPPRWKFWELPDVEILHHTRLTS